MKKIGKRKEVAFQEDADTFYASQAEPGVINGGLMYVNLGLLSASAPPGM